MARHALTPTCLALVQALERVVPAAMSELGVDSCRIGLSGGADSLALTATMAWVRDHRVGPLAEVRVSVRVVDHGLQAGSAEVASVAAQAAEDLGIAAQVVSVEVDPTRIGVEAAAREARYAALGEGDDSLILLAHTLDDQAETVLLGLARGSGTRSLAGMSVQRERIVRPFLGLRRADTEQACRDWGLTWWDDPTNTNEAYTRSRLRQAMGLLEGVLGPGLAEGLARTAALCRTDADHLDELAAQSGVDTCQHRIPVKDLLALDPAVRHRVLLTWLRVIGYDAVNRDHVLAVDSLLTDWHGQKAISVPAGKVMRETGELILVSH